MNLKEIRELIELVSEKGFAEFEVERQGFRLRISRFRHEPVASQPVAPVAPVIISSLPAPVEPHAFQHEPPQSATAAAPAQSAQPAPKAESEIAEEHLQIITSPIVGTFYRSPSPTSEAFVKIGDHIEVGAVVCIIEAMKLMNEIESAFSGEIAKIYVENGQPVEYGQPLFGIKS